MAGAATIDWETLCGRSPEAISDEVYDIRPSWVRGAISHHDARYLFRHALEARASTVVEIGTASGVSTAILARALATLSQAGLLGEDFEVITYDIDPQFYADRERTAGDAAREMLDAPLLDRITFRAPARAPDLRRDFPADGVDFLFIDASHQHPWPTLDLLGALDALAPGAEVVLHDVNLPDLAGAHADWGARYLFEGAGLSTTIDEGDEMPNIGSMVIPDDKEGLRDRLLTLLYKHTWETDPRPDHITEALL